MMIRSNNCTSSMSLSKKIWGSRLNIRSGTRTKCNCSFVKQSIVENIMVNFFPQCPDCQKIKKVLSMHFIKLSGLEFEWPDISNDTDVKLTKLYNDLRDNCELTHLTKIINIIYAHLVKYDANNIRYVKKGFIHQEIFSYAVNKKVFSSIPSWVFPRKKVNWQLFDDNLPYDVILTCAQEKLIPCTWFKFDTFYNLLIKNTLFSVCDFNMIVAKYSEDIDHLYSFIYDCIDDINANEMLGDILQIPDDFYKRVYKDYGYDFSIIKFAPENIHSDILFDHITSQHKKYDGDSANYESKIKSDHEKLEYYKVKYDLCQNIYLTVKNKINDLLQQLD